MRKTTILLIALGIALLGAALLFAARPQAKIIKESNPEANTIQTESLETKIITAKKSETKISKERKPEAKPISDKELETRTLQSIDILTGYGWGKLKAKDNYNLIPISVSFNFDLKPLLKKINLNLKQLFQFQIEPFFSLVSQPETNIEAGTAFWIKMGLAPDTWKLQPYAKIGAGMLYMTQHTREQSTQFNFIEQIGAGIQYAFTKNTALMLEGRWRHLSNASISHPNQGINTYFVLTGVTYKF